MQAEVSLIEPTVSLRLAFLEMAEEFHLAGENRYDFARDDFTAYLDRVEQFSAGRDLPPGSVRSDEYWLISNGRLIGRSGIRHRLTPSLENEGGNIGYDIRPSERRKRYGTLILKLALEKARDLGLNKVLVTCDEDNLGSAKIIERNGGVLSGKGVAEKSGKPILQYWIEL
jgi:predicted acetyltransferase